MCADINNNPVKAISVVSTGTVEIRPEHIFGTNKPLLWWLLTSRKWVRRPINVYIIDHSDGLVLFDTGQDRSSVTDPNYIPGRFIKFFYRRLVKFDVGPADTLTEQLRVSGNSILIYRYRRFVLWRGGKKILVT